MRAAVSWTWDAGHVHDLELGASGVVSFEAIINPPECAILAVGSCTKRLVPVGDPSAPATS